MPSSLRPKTGPSPRWASFSSCCTGRCRSTPATSPTIGSRPGGCGSASIGNGPRAQAPSSPVVAAAGSVSRDIARSSASRTLATRSLSGGTVSSDWAPMADPPDPPTGLQSGAEPSSGSQRAVTPATSAPGTGGCSSRLVRLRRGRSPSVDTPYRTSSWGMGAGPAPSAVGRESAVPVAPAGESAGDHRRPRSRPVHVPAGSGMVDPGRSARSPCRWVRISQITSVCSSALEHTERKCGKSAVNLCARGDLNPHVRGHQNLNLARLPISPLARDGTTVQTLPGAREIAKTWAGVSYWPVTRPAVITIR